MRVRFFRAFTIACMTMAAAIALTTPLAQATGWEHRGVGGAVSRVVGLTVYGATVLVVLNTSVLLLLERTTRSRLTIPRLVWATIGAGLAIVPVIVFSLPESSNLWEKVRATIQAQMSSPALLLSESLPMMLAGGVFGALVFDKRRNDQSPSNTSL